MSLEDKDRKQLYDIWKKRIRIARDLHADKVKKNADKFILEYSGDAKGNQDTGEKYEQICQVVMAIEERAQPHLFFQSPEFTAKAKSQKSEWEKREPLVAAMINHEYQDFKDTGYGIELENELCVLDSRILGYAATKTGYDVEGDILKEPVEEGMIDKAKNILTGADPQFTETPVITKDRGQVTERVSPLHLYLDPWATHITKQKFTVHWMDVSKSQLQKPRYDQDKIKDLEPSAVSIPDYDTKSKEEQEKLKDDPDFKAYRIYEIEDLENRLIYTIADGVNDFIEFQAPHPLRQGSQFSWLWFIEVIDKVYPMPPLKYYRKRASEFSYIYSQVSSQIDKFLPKIGINSNALDAADKQKFKTGGLGTFVEFNQPPAANWQVIQPNVQADLFKCLGLTKELLTIESGVPDAELNAPQADRTATEANKIDAATQQMRFKPKKRVKGFLLNQGRTIWQMIQRNSPIEHFVMILGEQAANEWWNDPQTGKASWTDENIMGDFSLDFDAESVTPQNRIQRMEMNNAALDRLSTPQMQIMFQQGNLKLKPRPLIEKYFKENLGIRDMDSVLEDLTILEPSEEHDLWMHGQFPQISPNEAKDPEMLLKHYQGHSAWIESPVFKSLPPVVQQGAMQHFQSYAPHEAMIQRMISKPQGGGAAPSQPPSAPKRESSQPSPKPQETMVGV